MVDIARQYPGQLAKPAIRSHASLRRFVRRRSTIGFLMCLPLLVIVAGLIIYPALYSIYLAMLNKARWPRVVSTAEPPPGSPERTLELFEFSRLLRRQKRLIATVLGLTIFGSLAYLAIASVYYTASAMMLFEIRTSEPFQQQGFGNDTVASAFVDSQVEVLKSDDIARSVVKRLNLLSDPEFVPVPGIIGSIIGFVTRIVGAGQLPGRLDPVQAGHPDVHQHHVGAQVAAHPHRLATVGRGTEHGEVRLRVQQGGKPGPHHLVVVGDDDPYGHWCILPAAPVMASGALAGSSASTQKPPPRASPAWSAPPTAAARSRMPSRPCPV